MCARAVWMRLESAPAKAGGVAVEGRSTEAVVGANEVNLETESGNVLSGEGRQEAGPGRGRPRIVGLGWSRGGCQVKVRSRSCWLWQETRTTVSHHSTCRPAAGSAPSV